MGSLLKLALVCLTMGGGSAAVVGKLAADNVDAKLLAHAGGFHPQESMQREAMRQEFIAQATEAKQAAQRAEMAVQRTSVMLEMLLRKEGLVPPPAPKPDTKRDAGHMDAGMDAG